MAIGSLRILDHQHIALQCTLGLVQCHEALAGLRILNDDLSAFDLIDIEGVDRLSVFQHDEVRDIDDVVDGTHPRVHQSLLEPPRGLLHLHVRDDSGNIALAAFRIFDLYGDVI